MSILRLKVLWVAIFVFAGCNLLAGNKADSIPDNLWKRGANLADKVLDMMAYETRCYTFAAYPMLGYSDRTGFEVGLMPVMKFNSVKGDSCSYNRPSTVAPSFQVSSKGMYEADVDVAIFTGNNWSINAKLQFLYLPDTFYGLGNNSKTGPFTSFDSYKYSAVGEVLRGVNERLFFGIQWDAGYYEFASISNPAGNPSVWLDDRVTGAKGGWCNGIGPIVRFDSRNDVVYPSRGWLASASWMNFGTISGSRYCFDNMMVDVRKYFSLGTKNQVLALHGYASSTDGNTPFYKLSTVAGKRLGRGIGHPYKYLDSNAWLVQAEYRRLLWWRIGAVAFAGAGNVFGNSASSVFDKTHLMGGLGLRFRALPKENLNIRLDAGVTNRGDHAIFFTIREAF